MPSYEYECQHCHAHIELVQSIENHPTPATCPSCGIQHTMVRVFNQTESNLEAKAEKIEEEYGCGNQEKNTDR